MIVLLLPFFSDCQDSILVHKKVLQKIASKLDSFDVLKRKEVQYIKYMNECDSLTSTQKDVISGQDSVISKMKNTINMMDELEARYKESAVNSETHIKYLEKQNKAHKIRNKIFLIGGGVLTVGLTTGLIIALLQ